VQALADGRATLHRHESARGDWFELMPNRTDACALSVTPNGPGEGELSLGVGRNEASFEAWGPADETLSFLGNVVDAVVAGRYEEYVSGRKIVGRLDFNDRPYVFSNNTFSTRWPPRLRRWRHDRYEPF
jgi:hypothetical protein